jgi:hypothetical protein
MKATSLPAWQQAAGGRHQTARLRAQLVNSDLSMQSCAGTLNHRNHKQQQAYLDAVPSLLSTMLQQRKPLKDSVKPMFLLLLTCRLRSLCSLGTRSSLMV